MRRNFRKATAAGDEAPLFFYSHLFLSHPETRALFPVSMMHQRDRLFAALGQVVALVDDLDALVPVLQGLGRDHRKFGTVAAHYPAVGASLLATLEHFDDEWDEALAGDWAAAYGLVAQVMVAAAEEAAAAPAWWDADVVSSERRTIDVTVLQVRPRVELPFRAGQSISVETGLRPRLWRYYAVANAPRADGVLELHVQAHDGGPVSSALARQVLPGDVLHLGPPLGSFTLPEGSDRDLLLVGAGTGLAPLKALLDEVARQGPVRRVDLFLGARTEAELYDLPALLELQEKHPWFTVAAVVSDDDRTGWEQGELTDVLLGRGPWTSREVFVAGPGEVVREVSSALGGQGLPRERLHTESFSPSRPSPTVEGKVST
jgi:NAD(P)H-flavin reductase